GSRRRAGRRATRLRDRAGGRRRRGLRARGGDRGGAPQRRPRAGRAPVRAAVRGGRHVRGEDPAGGSRARPGLPGGRAREPRTRTLAAHRRSPRRPHRLAGTSGARRLVRAGRGAAGRRPAYGVRRVPAGPPMRTWWHAVVESEHELQNPTSPDKILLLGKRLGLGPESHVLDIASGRGGPAILLAREFGCRLTCVERAPEFAVDARKLVE